MSDQLESKELSEEDKKKKLFTAYRIPMVGGASFYGIAHPEGGTVAPADGGSGGGE